ncbi:hypothetical protein [Duganella vulcania]|uniref:Uncharacterized protein n=1 Tax=Duganella vulcania TaxID=2692166 RepID=A0A845GF91_9BURK|nr:hypothetical protein [Duganella vulcania]MYM92601.1 hypothetical protein [Duganella vulcania]
MNVQRTNALVFNVPAFFADPAFMAWLNNDLPKFTWHPKGDGVAGDYSDVVVSVDASLAGEGADSDMPEHIWRQIVDACREHIGPSANSAPYMVRLTNLEG